MYKQQTEMWTLLMMVLALNFISFTIIKFNAFKEKYHTFYQCHEDNISLVFNGKEYKNYKLKFEKLYKMSPDCERID